VSLLIIYTHLNSLESFKLKYKLKEIPSKVTLGDMILYGFLNHILQHIFIISLIYLLLGNFNDSSLSTLFWLLTMYFIHDIIFFTGIKL
jgi:hypothetical protein